MLKAQHKERPGRKGMTSGQLKQPFGTTSRTGEDFGPR